MQKNKRMCNVSDEVNYNKDITMNKILMKVCEWLMAATQCLKLKGDGGEVKQQSCNEKDGENEKNNRRQSSSSLSSSSSESASLMLRMEEFVAEHYEVRYNRLSQQYELTCRGTEQWLRLDDEVCCRLLMEMNRVGIIVAKSYQASSEPGCCGSSPYRQRA